jgi:hypothetical protein
MKPLVMGDFQNNLRVRESELGQANAAMIKYAHAHSGATSSIAHLRTSTADCLLDAVVISSAARNVSMAR